jgi:hypothetical protein
VNVQLNHKVMGAENGLNYKGRRVRDYNAAADAWYGWIEPDDDDTTAPARSAGPSGVDQVDGARLELAMSAGRAALAAGFGRSSRADGKLECNHCVKCNLGRPDLCHSPMEPVVANTLAGQAQADLIAQAEADAEAISRVVWQEQSRRGVAL